MNQPAPAPVLKMDGKLAAITTASEQLADSLTDYKARFEKLDAAKQFPQAAMKAYLALDDILKALEKAQEAFKEAAIKHHGAGGSFEAGKIAITIKEQSRVTPKWQDECLDAVKKICLLEKSVFNKDNYIDAVKAKYPASVSKQVKLVESL